MSNIQVNSAPSFSQLPANRPAAEKATAAPAPAAPSAAKDGVSFGRGALSILGGTGAGLVSGTGTAAAVVLLMEKGLTKNFGGYVAVGGALGGAGALAGAAASTFFTNSPTSGAIAGAVTGAAVSGAWLGKTLGNGAGAALGAAIGAVGGGIGGYAAARIKH